MVKTSGIYYTDNRLNPILLKACQDNLKTAFDENKIVSVSLKPIDFGKNIVLDKLGPSYYAMVTQIITALEHSDADFVFYLEHDVLYHPSHFDFEPAENDVFYYSTSVWRWDYPEDRFIGYDGLTSLSQLCVGRLKALEHYKMRKARMEELGIEQFSFKDPPLARNWGYEPGRKKKKNGAFQVEKQAYWQAEYPNVDIRHHGSFTLNKVHMKDFKHKPTGWIETTMDKLTYWGDLKRLT